MKNCMIYGLILILFSCTKEPSLFHLADTKETGITFKNDLNPTKNANILDYLYFYNGGGLAAGDVTGDGLPDLYFVGNQLPNKLYRNLGSGRFEDITEQAGVAGNNDWDTGVAMADVNGDGWLDIYVCAVVGINGFYGHNQLFINNGDGTFAERAKEYGLDFENYSSSAAFFDYDGDGDLDLYLLNHAVHNQESFGRVDIRYERDPYAGDKLLRNEGNFFIDVSEQAGIFGGANGYGLGISLSDFNLDGWTDIYVGNDFHEDDYFYLNNGDGTFTESLKEYFGHISRFSMGNDAADINGDGYPDLISLDMLPENEKVLKSSAGDDKVALQRMRIEKLGYHYQFTRNMLQVNQRGKGFAEMALLSGVAATDWSWGALFGDYNQDGQLDLFISNGIPKRPNDLDYLNYVYSEEVKSKLKNTNILDDQVSDRMPSGAVPNYIFQGQEDLHFINRTGEWISTEDSYSNGCAFLDLDGDGDLDLVTNDIDHTPRVYVNRGEKGHYLKLNFHLDGPNKFGIGTRVKLYTSTGVQTRELYTTRGWQSSSEPIIHFGLGSDDKIDSLVIHWPNRTVETFTQLEADRTITLSPRHSQSLRIEGNNVAHRFHKVSGLIDFKHTENNFNDFDRQKLIPYRISDRGPALAIGDLDGDGKEDVFIGGARDKESMIFFQRDTSFQGKILSIQDKKSEDVAAALADLDMDGKDELILGTGGGEFYKQMEPLLDRCYKFVEGEFEEVNFPKLYTTASVIRTADVEGDGDLDIFIASNAVPYDFGHIPDAYLLRNETGEFTVETFEKLGMITDAAFNDLDSDGDLDLVAVGEWMPPIWIENDNGEFAKAKPMVDLQNGLYQALEFFDIDADGDLDVLLGNWGTNTKFQASGQNPMRMYYGDMDGDGVTETIVAVKKQGGYYPLMGLEELASQLVSIVKKRFLSYSDFAGKTMEELFTSSELNKMSIREVHCLSSGYLRNEGVGKFSFVSFGTSLQQSPINDFCILNNSVLMAGNYFGVTPYHGRMDGFSGALLDTKGTIIMGNELGLEFFQKAVRKLELINFNSKLYVIAAINNDEVQVYEWKN